MQDELARVTNAFNAYKSEMEEKLADLQAKLARASTETKAVTQDSQSERKGLLAQVSSL